MLTLKNIVKKYPTGDTEVPALKGIDIEFRKNEFVAILGPSGCGKTTLLNIVGGLDGYTDGDLIIGGKSTKKFTSADWDSYRNHSIGFVFQSYNLIPHQTVLSNVELALTLSGVSRSERRRRAKEALEKVGLGDQLSKKPNQMSGGQMQRVAIARALVNDPEILLADEPTGALDTATSVQIMDILREISKDKLIIMVTHNPELAEKYATRTIKLLDGRVVEDTKPYHGEAVEILSKKSENASKTKKKKKEKTSMSFFTALSLSLNNLMTKKTRTLLTGFAGSIGIIGIALILSVSSGVQAYIDRVQKDMLSSYPLTLEAESVDMNGLVTALADTSSGSEIDHELDKVYTNAIMYDLVNKLNALETSKNNLSSFKEYLETNEKFDEFVSAVQYSYDLDMGIYTKDKDGNIVKSDTADLITSLYGLDSGAMGAEMSSTMSQMPAMAAMSTWEELLPGENGELVNPLLDEQYDIVYGNWPENYDEVVLVVDKNNEITDLTLYALGLKTKSEMAETMKKASLGEQIDTSDMGSWSYEEMCNMTVKVIPASAAFAAQENGGYTNLLESETGLSYLYDSEKAIPLKIVGIIRASDDAVASMIQGSLAYTSALTNKLIELAEESEIVKAQLAAPETDAISGMPFKTGDDELTATEKATEFVAHAEGATEAEKAAYFKFVSSVPSEEYVSATVANMYSALSDEQCDEILAKGFAEQIGTDEVSAMEYVKALTAEEKQNYVYKVLAAQVTMQYSEEALSKMEALGDAQLAAQFDVSAYDESTLAALHDNFMPKSYSESTYEANIKKLGYVDKNSPKAINIFAKTFEDKDEIADLISEYNKTVDESDEITYTDYVALLMSSITTVISAISYVLIAFVAISLVVSSIMIGIITYISVLERTKEIGILRAIGASKKDVSRVFNAETLIVGFVSGAMGIVITLVLNVIINIILHALTGIPALNAVLPWQGAVILIGISMALTFIAGLIPSGIAAKKDPVVALRSE